MVVFQTKYLGLTFTLIYFLIACKSNKQNAEITTFTSKEWEKVTDTSNFWNTTTISQIQNSSENDNITYDWSKAVELLNSKKMSTILLAQNEITDTTFYPIEQPCIHEKDTMAFKKLIDSLILNSNLTKSLKIKLKDILLNSYNEDYFFKNTRAFCDTFFLIKEGNKEIYMKFRCSLGSASLDSLCNGKTILQKTNLSVTFPTNIYVGDLIFKGNLETYSVLPTNASGVQGTLINHKGFKGKIVYYLENEAKVLSTKSIFDEHLRHHKVLVSYL